MDSPIFIVGMARSGTSLLQSILNNHPNIVIPRETGFFYLTEIYQKKSKIASFSKEEIELFWNWYSKERRFTYLNLNKNEVRNNIDKTNNSKNFINVLDGVMNTCLEVNNKVRWGEKTPGHEMYLEKIFESYPKAKIIFMIRDPRAVYFSLKNVPWNNQFISVFIKRWNRSVKKFKEYRSDDRVLMVNYEELVNNVNYKILEICNFIGEEYNNDMLKNRLSNFETFGKNSWSFKNEFATSRKVDNSSIEKWKNNLNSFEVSVIENYAESEIFTELFQYSNNKFDIKYKLNYKYLKFRYYLLNVVNRIRV